MIAVGVAWWALRAEPGEGRREAGVPSEHAPAPDRDPVAGPSTGTQVQQGQPSGASVDAQPAPLASSTQPSPSVAAVQAAPDDGVELPDVPRWVARMRPARRAAEAAVLIKRAQKSLKRRSYDTARNFLRQALGFEPESPRAAHGMGAALLGTGDFDAAARWARRAIRLEPEDADADADNWALLADALQGAGDLPGAQAALEEAIRLDPRNRVLKRRMRIWDGP